MRCKRAAFRDCVGGIVKNLTLGKVLVSGVCLALTVMPSPASAQELRLHGVAGVAHAVGGYQYHELSWGGTARGAAELVALREVGGSAHGGGTWLGAGGLP